MSELDEQLWAVLSEHGCEAMGLSYTDAHRLMLDLKRKNVSGLCVITNDAARRVSRIEKRESRFVNRK